MERPGACRVADLLQRRYADASKEREPTATRLGQKAGVPVHLHALRHFAATHLVGAGRDIRTVSARLGHASTQQTLDVYTHAFSARDHEAAAMLGAGSSQRAARRIRQLHDY